MMKWRVSGWMVEWVCWPDVLGQDCRKFGLNMVISPSTLLHGGCKNVFNYAYVCECVCWPFHLAWLASRPLGFAVRSVLNAHMARNGFRKPKWPNCNCILQANIFCCHFSSILPLLPHNPQIAQINSLRFAFGFISLRFDLLRLCCEFKLAFSTMRALNLINFPQNHNSILACGLGEILRFPKI